MSGFGLSLLRSPRSTIAKAGVFASITVGALVSVEWIYRSSSQLVLNLVPYFAVAAVLLPIAGLFQKFRYGYVLWQPITDITQPQQLPTMLPLNLWFFVKLWRNPRSRNSFLLSMALAVIAAVTALLRKQVFSDPYPPLILGAILAATFSCEIRGLLRRYVPPEQALLTGLRSLVKTGQLAVASASLVIGLPIFFVLNHQADNSAQFLMFYIVLQLFAASAGHLAGSLLVPAQGETGSQFFAALLASGLVLLFPKAAHIADVPYSRQLGYWVAGAIVLAGCTYTVELTRRRSYGHA
jgi:hypothetical protein